MPIRCASREREWEAIDLIEKALTSHEGPFSWEGKFFSHAHVNVWPRPYQSPRPEFWAATSDLPTCAELGRRGIINTLLFGGYDRTRTAFNTYKQAPRTPGGCPTPPGEEQVFTTRRSATSAIPMLKRIRIGQKDSVVPHRQHQEAHRKWQKFMPGQIPPELTPAAWRAGASKRPTDLSVESLVRQGQMFCGNPDTVVRQIKDFRQRVGGVGRIIMMTRQGLVTHAEAMKSFFTQRRRKCCLNCRGWRRSSSTCRRPRNDAFPCWTVRDRNPPRGPG